MSRLIRLLLALLFLTLTGQGPGARPAAAQETTPDPLKEFVPHEKLPADSAVAFPVDL
jgi:hypothetical protein